MVFAVPGPRLLRWLGMEPGRVVHYSEFSSMDSNGQEEFGGICYYPTNG